MNPVRRIAAISDLHLGARGCYLHIPSVRERLFGRLNALSEEQLGSLVLVGDVVDLTVGRAPEPWVRAREFFRELSENVAANEYVYMPGNHDHHVWVLLTEHEELIKKIEELRSGYKGENINVTPVSKVYLSPTPMHKLFPGASRGRFKFAYPFYVPDLHTNTRLVFHHGHYFDKKIMPLAGYAGKRFGDVTKIEAFNLPYIEALFYLCSLDPQVQQIELRFYDRITKVGVLKPVRIAQRAWHRLRHMRGRRMVGGCAVGQIDKMMNWAGFKDIGLKERDVWVFGHTHKRDKYSPAGMEKVMELYDLGGWVLESGSHRDSSDNWATPTIFFADEQGNCQLEDVILTDEEKQSVRAKTISL